MSDIRTLRPGLLVSLNTRMSGNIAYEVTGKTTYTDDSGRQITKWKTDKVIIDPAEHERATQVRSKASSLIRSVCARSEFGLLCPEDKAEQLRAAIADARTLVDAFNRDARLTRLSVNVIAGRVEQNDVEATRAITGELRSLMSDMQEGLKTLDVKRVRDAANKAKSVGAMLSPDAQERLAVAIKAARASARKIVKAGEAVVQEIDREAIARIDMARTSFLDLEDGSEIVVPEADARGIEFDHSTQEEPAQEEPAQEEPITDIDYYGPAAGYQYSPGQYPDGTGDDELGSDELGSDELADDIPVDALRTIADAGARAIDMDA